MSAPVIQVVSGYAPDAPVIAGLEACSTHMGGVIDATRPAGYRLALRGGIEPITYGRVFAGTSSISRRTAPRHDLAFLGHSPDNGKET